MFAARREHLERVILPALAAGEVVLCDRFTDATFAYQGWGRGVNLARLESLEQWVHGSRQPDLTLYFDISVSLGQQRLGPGQQRDRFEREQADFFERVRAGYLDRAAHDPKRVRVIDGARSVSDIQRTLEDMISTY